MRIYLNHLDVFDSGDTQLYAQLERLFLRASQGQHQIHIDDPERIIESDFFENACSHLNRPVWEELVMRTAVHVHALASRQGRYAVVSLAHETPDAEAAHTLLYEQVGLWAECPLRILVENERDRLLVDLAAKLQRTEGGLASALQERWIVPEGRGGCGEVLLAIKAAASGTRIFVLVDSDRDEPGGESLNATVLLIAHECQERQVPIHILERRELENYIPESIWDSLTSQASKRRSRKKISPREQRKGQIYRWLLRTLEEAPKRTRQKFGQAALAAVWGELTRKANQSLPLRGMSEQMATWRCLDLSWRKVDDLKNRFRPLTDSAIEKMRDPDFDDTSLDSDAQEELKRLAAEIEVWL